MTDLAEREGTGRLPVYLTTFVGRQAELAELGALLDGHRLVTLSGAGGCGNTRLAAELGRQALRHHDAAVAGSAGARPGTRFAADFAALLEIYPLVNRSRFDEALALAVPLLERTWPGRRDRCVGGFSWMVRGWSALDRGDVRAGWGSPAAPRRWRRRSTTGSSWGPTWSTCRGPTVWPATWSRGGG